MIARMTLWKSYWKQLPSIVTAGDKHYKNQKTEKCTEDHSKSKENQLGMCSCTRSQKLLASISVAFDQSTKFN